VPEAHEARAELGRADRLKPEMPETLYSLGKAASLTGETSVAEAAWTKLINIENQSALAAQEHFGLAGLYRKQGNAAAAEREMQEFRKLQANTPASQK
jgi:tetratricopeptide (TPR) repeat protein